jgi:hypothetical protein
MQCSRPTSLTVQQAYNHTITSAVCLSIIESGRPTYRTMKYAYKSYNGAALNIMHKVKQANLKDSAASLYIMKQVYMSYIKCSRPTYNMYSAAVLRTVSYSTVGQDIKQCNRPTYHTVRWAYNACRVVGHISYNSRHMSHSVQ